MSQVTRLLRPRRLAALLCLPLLLAGSAARAATPCDTATNPAQCAWLGAGSLPPFVHDAIAAKGGVPGAGNVLVLSSGDPLDPDQEISNDLSLAGCGTNPDGWQTYDCTLLHSFVPPEDSVVLALSSEWFEWYQSIFTDWMTTSGAGVATVDVSINSWIAQKVDILPYGPWETGVVILTSLSAQKMVDFRVSDSGDHIYDTAIVVVPATWFSGLDSSGTDPTLLCGNGTLEPGEECDDGNNAPGDGCSTLCLGNQAPPPAPPAVSTCGNLVYSWPTGTTAPYTCGADLCAGFRCVVGNTISPACYTAAQCAGACAGDCVDVQTAQLDCSTMCTVQPPATQPPPPPPAGCASLSYAWPDGATMPYTCDDTCSGQRCVTGATISPECYGAGECDATTCPDGTCVDVPAANCGDLCALGEVASEPTCTEAEIGQTRPAPNQSGPCLGNVEICNSSLQWEPDDNSWQPDKEACNGIDDDCNGAVDDMFVTCGDPGLCQNTVNECDLANPAVPVLCEPLPAPSPVEICNNGLDDDCDGSADDGCECGDDDCMPGEGYLDCPADCPVPADGTACDDGDFCTDGDTWQAGACTPGAPVVCDSGNACVVDGVCDPATGCSATKLNCDDADPCTIDTCDSVDGCAHAPDPACAVDADNDGYTTDTDCNDADASVNPGAAELCNAVDDDCDGSVDEAFPVGTPCASAQNDCGQLSTGFQECSVDGLSSVCSATTPPNPTGYGDACSSAPNACGGTAAGTIGCDQTCSATTPPNPSGYGDACSSAPNVCGDTAAGTIGCDASCSATTPVAADGDGDGTADCVDGCPADGAKTAAGDCGCGVADVDTNGNGVSDCLDTARADVGVTVERLGETVRAGKRLRFRYDVTNAGPDLVTPGATVAITITGDVGDLKLPSECSGTADDIVCTTPELRAGRHKARRISMLPVAATTVVFTATVSSDLVDPNTANQSASVETVVP